MPVPHHLNADNFSGEPGRPQSRGQTWPAGPRLEKPGIEIIPQTPELFRLQQKWAGRGHMFLVAAGSRGIEAGPAAAAAYRQIAQVLQRPGPEHRAGARLRQSFSQSGGHDLPDHGLPGTGA